MSIWCDKTADAVHISEMAGFAGSGKASGATGSWQGPASCWPAQYVAALGLGI